MFLCVFDKNGLILLYTFYYNQIFYIDMNSTLSVNSSMQSVFFPLLVLCVNMIGNTQTINKPTSFLTEWYTDASTDITIYGNPTYTYNYTIYWTKVGSSTLNWAFVTSVDYTITDLEENENYIIEIDPFQAQYGISSFPAIQMNAGEQFIERQFDADKLLEVIQWGTNPWQTFERAFSGCSYLNVSALDKPNLSNVSSLEHMFSFCVLLESVGFDPTWDLSNVTNIASMFFRAESFNADIESWDVSKVVNMSYTFCGALVFNQPLNNWNVSEVRDMSWMFSQTDFFNQSLNQWNVSCVETMQSMFYLAQKFNQDLNSWNVSHVKDMRFMFANTPQFNGLLNNWNLSSVISTRSMFAGCHVFNQPLNSWIIGNNLLDMSSMFGEAHMFNQDLTNWNVTSVLLMERMFFVASSFNGDIVDWQPISALSMYQMFAGASAFNQKISNWELAKVQNMSGMFWCATTFDQDLNSWNVHSVIRMDSMFFAAYAFNGNISSWNTENVTNMAFMFCDAQSFNQDIHAWNVGQVTSIVKMFYKAASFDQKLDSWTFHSLSSLEQTDMEDIFYESRINRVHYWAIFSSWMKAKDHEHEEYTPRAGHIQGPEKICLNGTQVISFSLIEASKGGIWGSSDEKIMKPKTSNDGTFEVINTGKVTISYLVQGHNHYMDKALHDFTVYEPPNVTISGTHKLRQTQTSLLTVQNMPQGSIGIWSSSDPKVVTVDSTGQITGKIPGESTIIYTIIDQNGCKNTSTFPIIVVWVDEYLRKIKNKQQTKEFIDELVTYREKKTNFLSSYAKTKKI